MGGAMAEGLIKGDYIKNEDICISDPSRISRDKFADMGITATPSNQLAAQGADVVCVVVKPWLVEQVLKGIRDVMDYDKQILIVVAAGVKSESVKEWMTKDGGKMIPTFLVIPNIAIAQLASMTFIAPAAAVEQQHTDVVKELFDSMGKSIITDEQHLGGGVELGFKADEAKQIVMQTMKGAVTLLEATGLHPEAAIDLVTTPSGVTIKGLNEMEHAGFTSSVIRGLKAEAK